MEHASSIDARGVSSLKPAACRSERNLVAWIRLACLLLLATLAVPFFAGKVYVADDLGEYHLPLRDFYANQLARGESFDWLPSLFGGFYLTGEGQAGTYHPLHLALYRLLPVGAAFDLEALLSYPFMAIGMALFLRRRLQSSSAAWFGALVFTFSGFNLLHFVHPNAVAIVAHVPWILWAVDVAMGPSTDRQARWAAFAVGLLTASQLLLGYPQYVWFSVIAEAGFIVWRKFGCRGQSEACPSATEQPPIVSRHNLLRLLIAQGCGILAGAIQWLPTLDALSGSVRQSADAEFVNSGSLHPLNLVQLVAPYLFETRVVGQNTHELGLYIGAVPCLLCCWVIANRSRLGTLRPLATGTLLFAVVSLLLAFGEFGFVYSLQRYLPVIGQFRFPCRAIVLVHLAMAIGASLGFLLLIKADAQASSPAPNRFACLWYVVLLSVVFAILGPWLWSPYTASSAYVWLGPVLFAAAAIFIAQAARGRRWALAAIVLLAAADLGVYGASYSIFAAERTADLRQFVAATPAPEAHNGVHDREKVALEGSCGTARAKQGNRILLTGAARIDGYAGLEPKKHLDYRQPDNARLAGAQWIRTCENDVHWTAVENPAPRARLEVRVSKPEALDLNSHCSVLVDRPGQIEVTTKAAVPALLVIAESYHAGWRATVDGRPCTIVPVNGDFLGCELDAGAHRVDFQFRPASRRHGALLSACGLGLLLCSLVPGRRRAGQASRVSNPENRGEN